MGTWGEVLRGLHSGGPRNPEARAGALAAWLDDGCVGPLGGAVEGPEASKQVVRSSGRRTWSRQGRGAAGAEPLTCRVPWVSVCISQHLD